MGRNRARSTRYVRFPFSLPYGLQHVFLTLYPLVGKHDGVVKGERYFQTKPNHAVFTKYGQTNAVGGSAPAAGAKKAPAASSSSSASAKKSVSKIGSGIPTKPMSNPASSQVSSSTNSAAPTPPNEPEELEEDVPSTLAEASIESSTSTTPAPSVQSSIPSSPAPPQEEDFESPVAPAVEEIAPEIEQKVEEDVPVAAETPVSEESEPAVIEEKVEEVEEPLVKEDEQDLLSSSPAPAVETVEPVEIDSSPIIPTVVDEEPAVIVEDSAPAAEEIAPREQTPPPASPEPVEDVVVPVEPVDPSPAPETSDTIEKQEEEEPESPITPEPEPEEEQVEPVREPTPPPAVTTPEPAVVAPTPVRKVIPKSTSASPAPSNGTPTTKKTTSSTAPSPSSKIPSTKPSSSSTTSTPSKKTTTSTTSTPTKKTATSSTTSTPSRVGVGSISAATANAADDDDGPSAYEMEMKLKDLEKQLAKAKSDLETAKNESSELESANARLQNQLSILQEGSKTIMAQQEAGGAAREAAEAELKAQLRDIKSKLENSSEKAIELEKRNKELEQQVASVSKSNVDAIANAVQKATAELTTTLNKLKAETEEKIDTLTTDLEMAAMDKEIAEEERDTLVREIEALKMQNELLESSKTQNEEADAARRASLGPSAQTGDGEGPSDILSSPEYVALNTQHERLKEALVKLKDLAVEEKQQHEKAQREMENLNTRVIPSLEDKLMKAQEQNVDYEEQIEILKANIDDAAELQERYSELFEKKLDIEEDNKKLKSALKELEDIRELSDQLEEEQQAAESRLKAELYAKQVEVLDRETALKNAKEAMDAQNAMIDRLQGLLAEQRTATATAEKKLSSALKNAKNRRRRMPIDLEEGEMPASADDEYYGDQLLEDDDDVGEEDGELYEENANNGISKSSSTASVRSLQQKESELQVILQKQAAKAATQDVINKLRDLDRAQAIEQSALYQQYVPEQFIRVDSEAIKCLLLAKRLVEKSVIVVHYLSEQYHLDRFERSAVVQEDASALTPLTTTDELAYFAWRLAAIVTRMGTNAAIFAESFKTADADTFVKFARFHSELSPCEKKMDHLITLLQKEELTVSYSLTDFETLLDGIEPIVSSQCKLTALSACEHYTRLGRDLVYASRACFFEVSALKSTLNQLEQSLGVTNLVASIDLISLTIVKYLVDGSRKLRRNAEGRPALTYIGSTLSELRSAVRLAQTLHSVFANLRQKVISAGDRVDEPILEELRDTVVEQYMQIVEECMQQLPPTDATSGRLTKHYDTYVTAALRLLFTLDEDIARGAHDGAGNEANTKPSERIISGVAVSHVSQLASRSAVLLEEVAAAAGLKGELSSLQKELRERETTLGYKAKEIEDLEFRLKKQDHRLQVLEKVETDAKEELASHQKNYASQIMNLETSNRELLEQVDALQIESREAKSDAQKQTTRNAELEEKLALTLHKQQHSISLDAATTQISSLRATVKYLKEKVARLRSAESQKLLETKLPPLPVITAPFKLPVATSNDENVDSQVESATIADISAPSVTTQAQEQQNKIAKLLESAYHLSTSPSVVDLTRTDNSPSNQLESHLFETLRLKAALLEASRQTVQGLAEVSHAYTPSHFSSFPTTSFVSNINSTARGPIKLGKLSIPGTSAFPSVPKTLQVTSSDLCSIHSLLVK